MSKLNTELQKDKEDSQLSSILREAINTHRNPNQLIKAFAMLEEEDILTIEHVKALTNFNGKVDLAYGFILLKKSGILSPENRWSIVLNSDSFNLIIAMKCLYKAGILNQTNFNYIVSLEHSVLTRSDMIEILWARLSPHRIQKHWPSILEASTKKQAVQVLLELCNRILENKIEENPELSPQSLDGFSFFSESASASSASIESTIPKI